MPSTQTITITINDKPQRIAYIEMGNKFGTPLLYIHGWGCSKQDFAAAARNVSLTKYRLIAFDFPGCGESPYPASQSFSAADMVTIAHEVAVQLRATPAVIAGHSIGGALAIRYADRYPSDVLGIVSVAGNMTAADCFMTGQYSKQSKEQSLATYADWARTMVASKNPGYHAYGLTLERWTSPNAYYDYAHSIVQESSRGDLLSLFSALRLPKLFLYCEHNPASIDYIEKLLAISAGNAEIRGVADSEHFPGYENPVQYYQLLADFMDRTVQRSQATTRVWSAVQYA